MEQGTPEWHAARCGKVTASRIADLMAKPKKPGEGLRATYMSELLAERLSGIQPESYVSDDMRWGSEQEAAARDAYAFMEGRDVERVGFVDHPTIPMAGASPDGLIGVDGLLEIKCPKTSTHLETIRLERVPEKYLAQIHWQAACTRAGWCDFVSYDPRLQPELRYFCQRVEIDPGYVTVLELAVIDFNVQLEAEIDYWRAYVAKRRAA